MRSSNLIPGPDKAGKRCKIVLALAIAAAILTPLISTATGLSQAIPLSIVLVSAYDPSKQAIRVGTGFIIHRSGLIATCYHVIDQTQNVQVRLYNGRSYPATVVGTDGISDLAVLKISAPNLTPLHIETSASVNYGSRVWAYGFPLPDLGTDLIVTSGKVSGFRTYKNSRIFQLDLQVNPGNSGGPLIDDNGRVVGVVFSRLDPWILYVLTGTLATGSIAFATPVSNLYEIIPGVERYDVFNPYTAAQTHVTIPAPLPATTPSHKSGINWWYVLLGVIIAGIALEAVGYTR